MGDEDFIARIVSGERKARESAAEADRTALEKRRIAEQNAAYLWQEAVAKLQALTAAYNEQISHVRPTFQVRCKVGEDFVEITREVFPQASLLLRKTSAHFWEFRIERTESSFANAKGRHGRIGIIADLNQNFEMTAPDGTIMRTPSELSQYLIEPVLSLTRK